MSPKEKAVELINKYSNELEHIARISDEWSMSEFSEFRQIIAIKCASLAIDEILSNIPYGFYSGIRPEYKGMDLEYWQEVKQEIEKQ